MNRVYVLAPGEDWIVDRFVQEWDSDNRDIRAYSPRDADVIWLLADWCWQRIPQHQLSSKKVLVTVHHVVPEKFNAHAAAEFAFRDQFVTAYHVPNKHTEAFIRPLTQKPIHVIPYWANQHIWRPTGTREALRMKHGLPMDKYLIGSFQRDTEGTGIPQGIFEPKLEKGPDLLCDMLEFTQNCTYPKADVNSVYNQHVVLAGWRRQYVIARLERAGIPYSYFEKPSQEVLNELYQTLDLYPVTSRYEGGPQALIEAGLLNVPVVSRDVGMADQLLSPLALSSTWDGNIAMAVPEVPSVEHLKLPRGYEPYRKLIESL